jgi:hypothetical protein
MIAREVKTEQNSIKIQTKLAYVKKKSYLCAFNYIYVYAREGARVIKTTTKKQSI